jgi:predicted transcriptional regulator
MTVVQTNKATINAVSVKLDNADRERLSLLATAKKRTAHYLMKEAIRDYIEREESRLNFIRAAQESAKQMDNTGLHLTSDEVSAWVEALKSNPAEHPPQCHV